MNRLLESVPDLWGIPFLRRLAVFEVSFDKCEDTTVVNLHRSVISAACRLGCFDLANTSKIGLEGFDSLLFIQRRTDL